MPSLIPQHFFKHTEDLVPKVSRIWKALCVKFHAQTVCSLRVMSIKTSRKLENVVSTILLNNNNIFTLDDYSL